MKNIRFGLFEFDGFYEEFITQGAKKYAYITKIPLEKAKKKGTYNVLRTKDGIAYCLGITVSGVPKSGAKCLKSLKDFKDNLIFTHKFTNKNILFYNENQIPVEITDFQKKKFVSCEKIGACIVPTTYELSKAEDYATLVCDESAPRSKYKEF